MQSFFYSSRYRLLTFAILFFLAYLFAACYLFKERIFLDGAYYFFHVVNSEQFRIEHQRYILAASQTLTWLGTHIHLPLQTLMLLNSINPVLYWALLFILCFFWLKHEGACWALLLLAVCGVYFLYFCPMYEVWYGNALIIFFFALLDTETYRSWREQLFFGFILITTLFAYPLLVFPVMFFIGYHILEKGFPQRKVMIQWTLLFIFWLLYKYFFISDYESGKISWPASQLGTTIKINLGNLQNLTLLLKFLFEYYGEVIAMAFIAIIVLFIRRNIAAGMLIFSVFIGFILLINFTQQTPWVRTNYFERMYLTLVPICILPFMREVFTRSGRKLVWEILFFTVIISRGTAIIQHAGFYTQRNWQMQQFIAKAQASGGSKFYLDDAKHPEYSSFYEWSLPMETILFSSLKNNEHTVCISALSDLKATGMQNKLNANAFHLRLDEVYEDGWLNQHYFHLQEGSYHELNPQ